MWKPFKATFEDTDLTLTLLCSSTFNDPPLPSRQGQAGSSCLEFSCLQSQCRRKSFIILEK